IGRAGWARDHLEHGARLIVAAEQRLRIEPARRVDDRRDFGVEYRASGKQDAVLPAADDFTVFDDHGPEWPPPALLDRLDRQPRCFFHEFAIHCDHPCLRSAKPARHHRMCLRAEKRSVAREPTRSTQASLAIIVMRCQRWSDVDVSARVRERSYSEWHRA